MNHQKSELYFLLILLVGVFFLTFFIFRPFLYALILAIVFANVFNPIYNHALNITKKRRGLAALLVTVFVLIIIIAPFIFLSMQIFQEASGLYTSVTTNSGATDIFSVARNTIDTLMKKFIPAPIEFSFDYNQYLKQGLSWLLQYLYPLFSNIIKAILSVFVFLIALYYLFKDGHKLKEFIITLSPLQNIHNETTFNKLALTINSVIKGSLVVALVQGILTAIGFAIFGIPNIVLWGSVATISALIPGIGTALVLVPAILFLFLSGKTIFAVGLLVWGVVAVGLADNFLRPILVKRGTRLHPFLILLSILGGIGFFGPLGFLLGPIILSLLFILLEIYFTIRKEHEEK